MYVAIDADSIVYMVGFAGESSDYEVAVFRPDGEVDDVVYVHGLDEVRAVQAQLPEGYGVKAEHLITEEPLEHALANTKRSLLTIEHTLRVEHKLSFDKMMLFLTGEGNHRFAVGKVRPYKGNRIAPRPVHYEAIRAYLQNRWGASVINGCEADDALATLAHSHEYDPERLCLVSLDKDLLTVPGRHYNFRRRTMVVLTEAEARGNFYRQMLTGDPTDNVLGCYKSGPARAEKLIKDTDTEHSQACIVLGEFAASMSRVGCPYRDRDPRSVMTETGILLHLQRWPGQVWRIPDGI